MQLGLQIHRFRPGPAGGNEWDSVLAQAQAAEAAGFTHVFLYDHFMWRRGDPRDPDPAPVLECYAGLAGLAVATRRVKLGALVAGAPYRNPALHAKIVATLDVMSHGRAIFGVGAAWARHEFEAYDWPFEETRVRLDRLEEAVQVARALWTERPATFQGRYHALREALCDPPPVQKPHPPILIGGGGEQRTLRLVARYADYCNVFGGPDEVASKYAVLRRHCQAVGRDEASIVRSNFAWALVGRDEADLAAKRERHAADRHYSSFEGTVEQVIARLREYARVGSQLVTLQIPDAYELEVFELFRDEIIPALRDA